MVFGTLINAVLNKPKLIALDEQEMIGRLALAMFLQLDHEAAQPRKAAVHQSSRAR